MGGPAHYQAPTDTTCGLYFVGAPLEPRPLLQVAAPALEHHRPGGGIAPQRQIPVYRIIPH